MITLPPDFDVALLVSDFVAVAAPFVSIAFLFACGIMIANLLKRF